MNQVKSQKPEMAKGKVGFNTPFAIVMVLLMSFVAVIKLKDTYVEMDMRQTETITIENWGNYLSLDSTAANPADPQAAQKKDALKQQIDGGMKSYKVLKKEHSRLMTSILIIFVTFLMIAFAVPFQKRWILIASAVPGLFGLGLGIMGLVS